MNENAEAILLMIFLGLIGIIVMPDGERMGVFFVAGFLGLVISFIQIGKRSTNAPLFWFYIITAAFSIGIILNILMYFIKTWLWVTIIAGAILSLGVLAVTMYKLGHWLFHLHK